jgi:hypothetical protein
MPVDSHDPTARVFFLLIRDNIPPGVIESAIERARAIQKEVPDSGIGRLASILAEEVQAL